MAEKVTKVSVRDIVLIAMSQVKFVANHAYDMYMNFSWGKINDVNIHKVRYGEGVYHSLNPEKIESEYDKLRIYSWSHGNNSFNVYLKAETLIEFENKLRDLLWKGIEKHKSTLDAELQKYVTAKNTIDIVEP